MATPATPQLQQEHPMARLDSFLRLVVDQQASDLHFHAGKTPIIRHNGDMIRLPFRTLSEREARRFVMEILSDEQREKFHKEQDIDFLYELEGVGRFRGNAFLQQQGISAVFRVIPHRMPTLDQLRMPRVVKKLIHLTNGLVLITGPTGSGKTTTLAALIHEINRKMERHVISIEDPIEFVHQPIKSCVTQRQVGRHVASFADALRSALREAPDVLVVGELRDVETVSLALSASETGVLVIGTLHTSSAPKAISRIIEALPEESRVQMRSVLAVLLRAVVSQRLCKRADGEGRVAAVEILLQNWAISHLIRDDKVHQLEGYLQSANPHESGMQSMELSLLGHVRDGLLEQDEALKAANNTEMFLSLCSQLTDEV
jgi:twitching motility protein PilT